VALRLLILPVDATQSSHCSALLGSIQKHRLLQPNVADQARLSAIPCIRLIER